MGVRRVRNLFQGELRRDEGCHGGRGHVDVFRPFERRPGGLRVDFIDLAIVPPGSEIGRHRHGDDEEWYVVLEGSATMLLDGEEFPVSAGDIVINRPFGEHGLRNDSGHDVRLFVFQASR
ncbi:cupin domain-containing protein [Streptomyces sp. enrichment culture]|uniref:cupin domain-containing protein n=1 Tax=Streptomyces sp. enrichment culture TaxID=1795815 RepID=UPI003F553578